MSTEYYRMRAPVTSVRLDATPGGTHDRVRVWVDHKLSGELLVDRGVGPAVCLLFARDAPTITAVGLGGGHVGLIVQDDHHDDDHHDGECLVSELGDVTTWRELHERVAEANSRRRQAGMQ